jgi:hypothetical protein
LGGSASGLPRRDARLHRVDSCIRC